MKIARHYTLITLDGVKDLREWGFNFKVRYELVESEDYGSPKYHCIYLFEGKEAILIAQRKAGQKDVKYRTFNLWPGLLNHHHDYGDGTTLCINKDNTVVCVTPEKIAKIKE